MGRGGGGAVYADARSPLESKRVLLHSPLVLCTMPVRRKPLSLSPCVAPRHGQDVCGNPLTQLSQARSLFPVAAMARFNPPRAVLCAWRRIGVGGQGTKPKKRATTRGARRRSRYPSTFSQSPPPPPTQSHCNPPPPPPLKPRGQSSG